MKFLVCLSLLAGICTLAGRGANAGLTISGPQYPVQEGEDVVLECLSDSESDMGNYTFQKYSTWMKTWVQLDSGRYLRCWFFNVNISRVDRRLFMELNDVTDYQKGPYRCVSSGNQTSDYEVSENFTISVIYLQDIYLQKAHSWRSSVSDVVWVEEGSTLEVKCTAYSSQEPIYEWSQEFSDWILPSDTLIIKNVNEAHEGKYICLARHPDMFSLVKTKSFELRVMPKGPEHVRAFSTGLNLPDILLYITIPAVLLATLVFSVFIIILRHRRQQLRKPQISLVDGEKRTPIYKGSLQSVSSTTSDTQPLVM
ncbi:cell surface glycoprotein MUC18-like [Mixophyes fleayi]|uniref:cell surface glycoprotein MUC18-like n=1 Tax=Mixophyes fleayi TaxID=3061075 RepID=UPI003F4DD151